MISPAQCRAARALLDWTQAHLAAKAIVTPREVQLFERGDRPSIGTDLAAVLMAAGVRFVEGGVVLGDKP
jgi:transcriptional regulator with XRE-family HTH domain